MIENVTIQPMGPDFILWRCLHSGPLSRANLDAPPAAKGMDWDTLRARNVPLLRAITAAYGSCALLASDGDQVVGYIRFYPKAVTELPEAGGLCLQQFSPEGPEAALATHPFPPLEALQDKTLVVHCMMTGSPAMADNPYQRKGLGSRLARALVDWGREQGWAAIETYAYEEIPTLYRISGVAGHHWWERLGFRAVSMDQEPGIQGEFLAALRREVRSLGLDPSCAANRYLMRLEL